MKILCWNLNGIRACWKKGLGDYLLKVDPDIACFQETKAHKDQCFEIVESLRDWRQVWHSADRPGYSGCLTLTRPGLGGHDEPSGLADYDREGRIVVSRFKNFTLLNMYFPNGGSGEERHLFKMRYLEEILPYFQKLDKKENLILTGDFNIAHRAIDIHDPVGLDGESGFKPEEREWMDRLVDAGFTDVFRHFNPDARDQYSWWSYRQFSRRRNKGWRIDYFMVSKRLEKSLSSMVMDQAQEGSDHCPLILEIDL